MTASGSGSTPLSVLNEFLDAAFDPDRVSDAAECLVADDATYVSLNFDDPDLHKIMPWAGTKVGRAHFVDNFLGVTRQWHRDAFEVSNVLQQGDDVALFGRFTLRSVSLNQATTSPFAVLATVRSGKIVFFQYMEDTFATARTFKAGGAWEIVTDPAGASSFTV